MWLTVAKSSVLAWLNINYLCMKFGTKRCHKNYLLTKKVHSFARNQIPVSFVTDGDTHCYTAKDLHTSKGFLLLLYHSVTQHL